MSKTNKDARPSPRLPRGLRDIEAAEQKARFARMDFDKFLGDNVTGSIIAKLGLDRILEGGASNLIEVPEPPPASAPVTATGPPPGGIQAAAVPGSDQPRLVMVAEGTGPDVLRTPASPTGGPGSPVML